MTSKERVLATLRHGEPDIVPHFEWVLSPVVRRGMTGSESELDFIESCDIDGIAVGPDERRRPVDSGHFRDEWGVVRVSWGEYPNAVAHPVDCVQDLLHLQIPDPDADYRLAGVKAAMQRFGDERAVIIRLRDVFSQPRDLLGFSGFLAGFYEAPDMIAELMRVSVEYSSRLAKNAWELGVRIIVVGDDIASNEGPLVSPQMYRRQVLPQFRQLIMNFKKLGFLVIKHTDGNIMPIIDDLAESGIDCIDPIDPLGGMDLQEMKLRYGEKLAIKGNVDCVKTLVSGTPADVRKSVRACIRTAGFGGGYILSSSNSIHDGVDPCLYRSLLSARLEFGRYPLDAKALERTD